MRSNARSYGTIGKKSSASASVSLAGLPFPEAKLAVHVADGRLERLWVGQHPVLLAFHCPRGWVALGNVNQVHDAEDLRARKLYRDFREREPCRVRDASSGFLQFVSNKPLG